MERTKNDGLGVCVGYEGGGRVRKRVLYVVSPDCWMIFREGVMSGDSDSHESTMKRDSGRRRLSNIVDLSMHCHLYKRETLTTHIHKDTSEKYEGRGECKYSRQGMSQQQLLLTPTGPEVKAHVLEHILYSEFFVYGQLSNMTYLSDQVSIRNPRVIPS